MTDAELALKAVKNNVNAFASKASNQLVMLFGVTGGAKGPEDVAAIADGRETIIAKLGNDIPFVQLEAALKTLSEWAK